MVLKGKVALVTGAGGAAQAACDLAYHGCRVTLGVGATDPHPQRPEIPPAIEVMLIDTSDAKQVKKLVNATVWQRGAIHILINHLVPPEAEAARLYPAVWAMRAVLPFMCKQRWGCILNVFPDCGAPLCTRLHEQLTVLSEAPLCPRDHGLVIRTLPLPAGRSAVGVLLELCLLLEDRHSQL